MKIHMPEFCVVKREKRLFRLPITAGMEAANSPDVALMQKQATRLFGSHPEHLVIGFAGRRGAHDLGRKKVAYLFEIGAFFLRITKLNGASEPGLHPKKEPAFLAGFAFDRLLRHFVFFRSAAGKIAAARGPHHSDLSLGIAKDGVHARTAHVNTAGTAVAKNRHLLRGGAHAGEVLVFGLRLLRGHGVSVSAEVSCGAVASKV